MADGINSERGVDMNASDVRRTALLVNTVILALVFGLMGFFHMCGADFLTLFSIPTAAVYVIGYVLIFSDKLDIYVWMIYFWLTLYMCITTLCLGYGYGFHLYCFSMIPVMFVTEYIAYKLHRRSMRAMTVSCVIAAFYILCTGYVACFGPIYERDQKYAAFFWIFNALIVFGFLIYYTNYMIRAVILSEKKLIEAAHVDRLTKLYNRHYMLDRLNSLPADSESFLAMSDIDNFKRINDTYGHNAGDEVLKTVAAKLRSMCDGCEVARWGGEEFLILSAEPLPDGVEMLEKLRKSVAGETVSFNGTEISVTLTIGVAVRESWQNVEEWVQAADKKLYYGKNSGKNKVVN